MDDFWREISFLSRLEQKVRIAKLDKDIIDAVAFVRRELETQYVAALSSEPRRVEARR